MPGHVLQALVGVQLMKGVRQKALLMPLRKLGTRCRRFSGRRMMLKRYTNTTEQNVFATCMCTCVNTGRNHERTE